MNGFPYMIPFNKREQEETQVLNVETRVKTPLDVEFIPNYPSFNPQEI